MRRTRAGALAAAAVVAALAAGCAGPEAKAREGAFTVAPIERLRWDLPPEPGLFRAHFDEAAAEGIRRRAARLVAAEDVDYYHAEIRVLEREVEEELHARALCQGTVKLASPVRGGEGRGIGGLFRCRASLF